MKHTPLSWKLIQNGSAYNIISEGETRHHFILINMLYVEDDEFQANAELIIRACNNHYDLIDALKRLCSVSELHDLVEEDAFITAYNNALEVVRKVTGENTNV